MQIQIHPVSVRLCRKTWTIGKKPAIRDIGIGIEKRKEDELLIYRLRRRCHSQSRVRHYAFYFRPAKLSFIEYAIVDYVVIGLRYIIFH